MHLGFSKNKENSSRTLLAKVLPNNVLCAQYFVIAILFVVMGVAADNLGYADEEENRRVDISLSIFPRIVAVDNNFRSKLNAENKVKLVFLYREDKDRAQSLAELLISKNKNIGGMGVTASTVGIQKFLDNITPESKPTAIFLSERLSDDDLKKVAAIAEKSSCIVFSPFTGDVERGVAVGISVTNRVKPYFNIQALKRSKIVINALLMKMSKRYE
jgi:hypothetical protein